MFSGSVYISGTEHNMTLRFSMLTYLTHINTLLEYYHASVIIDVLYLEDGSKNKILFLV